MIQVLSGKIAIEIIHPLLISSTYYKLIGKWVIPCSQYAKLNFNPSSKSNQKHDKQNAG